MLRKRKISDTLEKQLTLDLAAFRRLRQEDHHEFKSKLGYAVSSTPAWVRPCLNKPQRRFYSAAHRLK